MPKKKIKKPEGGFFGNLFGAKADDSKVESPEKAFAQEPAEVSTAAQVDEQQRLGNPPPEMVTSTSTPAEDPEPGQGVEYRRGAAQPPLCAEEVASPEIAPAEAPTTAEPQPEHAAKIPNKDKKKMGGVVVSGSGSCQVCHSHSDLAVIESQNISDGVFVPGCTLCHKCINKQPTSNGWKEWIDWQYARQTPSAA